MSPQEKAIVEFFENSPNATLTTHEATLAFRGTPHSIRQAIFRLRRQGVFISSVRVWRLRTTR